jgi:NADPH:quinone reductase-like Zn-dependent oxidoreductase
VDYSREDFASNGLKYDIIFDAVGITTFSHCKNSLTQKGIFLEGDIGLDIFRQVLWTSLFASKKAKVAATGLRPPHERVEDLKILKTLMETAVIKLVIDRQYDLDQIAEAHRYVDKGRKKEM